MSIGSNVSISRGTNGNTVIADHVKIDDNTHIPHNVLVERCAMIINGVMLGGSCVIGHHSWVGTGARVRNGVKIAPYTMVGMGAVVVKDTEELDVVIGNPARFMKKRDMRNYYGK